MVSFHCARWALILCVLFPATAAATFAVVGAGALLRTLPDQRPPSRFWCVGREGLSTRKLFDKSTGYQVWA